VLISIRYYLYRNSLRRAIVALLSLFLLGGILSAQIRDRTQHEQPPPPEQPKNNAKSDKGRPRAIAVVEFLPGGVTRLVPIALWLGDRFYDASLYGSNPEPMALQPETVYEVTDYGEPTGLFTVITPKEVSGNWIADGRWKPQLALDQRLAAQAAKQPKPKTSSNHADERPTLKRSGSEGSASAGAANTGTSNSTPSAGSGGSSASSAPVAKGDDPDRPTLKKPAPATPPPATSTASDKGTATAAASAPAINAASGEENDPNRPVLRRGTPPPATTKPAAPTTVSPSTAKSVAAMEGAQSKLMTTMASMGRRSYPAVSDAGPYQPRSLLYAMNAEERSARSDQMRTLALTEIRAFISKRKTPPLAKTVAIADFELRAFDLDYSSSPTLVMTAKLPVESAKALRGGEFDYFVTVVAREDINGTPIKIFSSVTDSNHLDAFARMEIIDAVDADANGRGDLLFRQYSDTGINYGLYRVFPYQMQKVFEGGSGI
jgi:hypothetical protein